MRGGAKPTETIQAACVEICESRFDRVLFSVIDTPGLDFQEGRELVLERQLGRVVRYLDQQYADTMSEVRRLLFIFILYAISTVNSECIEVYCGEGLFTEFSFSSAFTGIQSRSPEQGRPTRSSVRSSSASLSPPCPP